MINEALTEEIQRGEQRKERNSIVTTAGPAPKLAASTPHELIERIRLDWTRIPRKAASGSGQQRVKRSAEPEAEIGVPMEVGADESAVLPSAMAANTRRRVDEYREC